MSNMLEIILNILSFIMLKTTARERNFNSIFFIVNVDSLIYCLPIKSDIYPIPQACSQRTHPFGISIVEMSIWRLSEVLKNNFEASLLQLCTS